MKLHTTLLLLCFTALPLAGAQDTQARAQAMFQQARKLSDLRSPGSPAFRMKVAFSFTGSSLETMEGTYTETWLSVSEWRREIEVGDMKQIEVGGHDKDGVDKRWIAFPDRFPRRAARLPYLMDLIPPSTELHFTSVAEKPAGDLVAECAITTPVIQKNSMAFCFEKKSGVLLEKVIPESRPRNLVDFSCEYGLFRKFGNYTFPREVMCFEEHHKTISAQVVDLAPVSEPDPLLLAPPAGAIALSHCSGKSVAPTLNGREEIFYGIDPDNVGWMTVWFVVDEKGRPQYLKILRSPENSSLEKALKTVEGLRFKAGTCEGKPIAMPLSFEFPVALK